MQRQVKIGQEVAGEDELVAETKHDGPAAALQAHTNDLSNLRGRQLLVCCLQLPGRDRDPQDHQEEQDSATNQKLAANMINIFLGDRNVCKSLLIAFRHPSGK